MATNYRFKTASYSVEEISDLFCTALDLNRLKALSPTPIVGDAWWAAVTSNDAKEFGAAGQRLGESGSYTSIAFVPDKRLPWEDEVKGLAKILQTVVDLLAREPESSGFLEFYDEIIVLEKQKSGPIVVDPRLLDENDLGEELFSRILAGYRVAPIEQF